MKLLAYALCVLLLAGCPPVDNQIEEAIKKIEKPDKKDPPKGKKEVAPVKGKVVKPLKPGPGKLVIKKEVTPPGGGGSGTSGKLEAKKEGTPLGSLGEIAEKLKKGIEGIGTPAPKPAEKSGEGTPEESTPEGDGTPGPTETEIKTATEKLFTAVKANDISKVNEALEEGADVKAVDSNDWTALRWSIENGNTDIAKALIDKGTDVKAKDKTTFTPLMYAASGGHTDIVKALIAKGADVNAEDDNGATALMLAARNGHTSTVEALMAEGANVDAEDTDGDTALSLATDNGHTGIVNLLSEAEGETPTEQLFTAVAANDVEALKQAIAGGADTEAKDSEGYTPLQFAVIAEKPEAIKALIQGGANPDTIWKYGFTALRLAVQYKKIESLKAMIEAGAVTPGPAGIALRIAAKSGPLEALESLLANDVVLEQIDSKSSRGGNTALMIALDRQISRKQSLRESIEFTRALITAGADVNLKNNAGQTALLIAAKWGNEDVVIELLKADPQPELEVKDTPRGTKALRQFVIKNKPKAVQALVNAGARFNDLQGDLYPSRPIDIARQRKFNEIITILQTALDALYEKLFYAVEANDVGAVTDALKKGADVNAKDDEGYTALLIAAEEGSTGIVRALLEVPGIDIGLKDTDGMTALMFAANEGHTDIVKALLDKEANANAVDNNQKTALMYAAGGGHLAIVRALLDAGARIDNEDNKGETALSLATEQGHTAIIKLLAPPNLDARDKLGRTPLMYVASLGYTFRLESLISEGADVNVKDNEGKTPLMFAAENGHIKTVQSLIKAGANVNAEDTRGIGALAYAETNGHQELVDLLKAKGATK